MSIYASYPFEAGSGGGGSGTVTSVGLTVPSFLSVSGSPITTSGTLAVSLSGTALPVANGGTSLTTLTANNVILGNGTSAPSFVAPGTSGNVLTSNGTTFVSQAPAFARIAQILITSSTHVNSVTFSSIPQGFTNLKLVFSARSALNTFYLDNIYMVFNGDTSASYGWAQNGLNTQSNMNGDNQIVLPGAGTNETAIDSVFNTGSFIIGNYSANLNPSVSGIQYASFVQGGSNQPDTINFSGVYYNNTAVTSITLPTASGDNYETGSIFTLYGLL